MKAKVLLIAPVVLLALAVALLVRDSTPAPVTTTASAAATKHPRPAKPRVEGTTTKSVRPETDDESLSAWADRFRVLLAQSSDRSPAIETLLEEIDATYRTWVAEQLATVTELEPGERYDELSDIERSVHEGTASILTQLGIDECRQFEVSAGPSEAIAAEVQYAEAAPDSGSRLALLRLDRERQERMEKALALTGEEEKTQALAELDAWYETGLGAIFAPVAAND